MTLLTYHTANIPTELLQLYYREYPPCDICEQSLQENVKGVRTISTGVASVQWLHIAGTLSTHIVAILPTAIHYR